MQINHKDKLVEHPQNPKEVLQNIDILSTQGDIFNIDDVQSNLLIFYYERDTMTHDDLMNMKEFLTQAVETGFTDYCRFDIDENHNHIEMNAYNNKDMMNYALMQCSFNADVDNVNIVKCIKGSIDGWQTEPYEVRPFSDKDADLEAQQFYEAIESLSQETPNLEL